MIRSVEKLTPEEEEIVLKAPVWIGVLIAGADLTIDADERADAIKTIGYRRFTSSPPLHEYFEAINDSYEADFDACAASMPSDRDSRNEILSGYLAQLNSILPKLEPVFARRFYVDMLSFAEHIAKSSGGIFHIFAETPEEHKLRQLPMIEKPEGVDQDLP